MVGSERPEEHAVVVAAMQTTQQILDSINKVSEPAMEDIQFTWRNLVFGRKHAIFIGDIAGCTPNFQRISTTAKPKSSSTGNRISILETLERYKTDFQEGIIFSLEKETFERYALERPEKEYLHRVLFLQLGRFLLGIGNPSLSDN